jgi:hypothetical protein
MGAVKNVSLFESVFRCFVTKKALLIILKIYFHIINTHF